MYHRDAQTQSLSSLFCRNFRAPRVDAEPFVFYGLISGAT